MATRFYLPSSGTAPLTSLAFASSWEHTAANRYPCYIKGVQSKANTALANTTATFPDGTTDQYAVVQFQSAQLPQAFNFTTSHTISMSIRCTEGNAQVDAHLAYNIRVVSGDGTTVRGTLGEYHATSTEFTTSAVAKIHNARAFNNNVSAQAGDRIIIELGAHGVTPSTAYSFTLRFGDPTATTSDMVLTDGDSNDYCPWVEISAEPFKRTSDVTGSACLAQSRTSSSSGIVTSGLVAEFVGKLAYNGGPNSNSDTTNRTTWEDNDGSANATLGTFDWDDVDSGWDGNGTASDPYRLKMKGDGSDNVSVPITGIDVVKAAGSSGFTYEAWAYVPDSQPSGPLCMICSRDTVGGTYQVSYLGFDNYSNQCRFYYRPSGGTAHTAYQSVTYNTGLHHLVGVFEPETTGGMKVYVDGSNSGATNATELSSDCSALDDYNISFGGMCAPGNVWSYPYPAASTFTGAIATVRIYNDYLSSAEVLQNYNAGILAASTDPADITGSAHLKLATSAEKSGAAHLTQTSTPRNQEVSGAAHINGTVTSEKSGAGHLKLQTYADKSGASHLKLQTNAEKNGAGHLLKQVNSTPSGSAHLLEQEDLEVYGAGHLKLQTYADKTGAAHLKLQTSAEKSGAGHLYGTVTSEKTGAAHLKLQTSATPSGAGHLKLQTSAEPTGAAALLLQTLATADGASHLKLQTEATKEGAGHLLLSTSATADGAAHLVEGESSVPRDQDVSGSAHLLASVEETASGSAHLLKQNTQDASGAAHLQVASSADVTGAGVLLQSTSSDVSGAAHLLQHNAQEISGAAHVVGHAEQDVSGAAALLQSLNTEVSGAAHLLDHPTATLTSPSTLTYKARNETLTVEFTTSRNVYDGVFAVWTFDGDAWYAGHLVYPNGTDSYVANIDIDIEIAAASTQGICIGYDATGTFSGSWDQLVYEENILVIEPVLTINEPTTEIVKSGATPVHFTLDKETSEGEFRVFVVDTDTNYPWTLLATLPAVEDQTHYETTVNLEAHAIGDNYRTYVYYYHGGDYRHYWYTPLIDVVLRDGAFTQNVSGSAYLNYYSSISRPAGAQNYAGNLEFTVTFRAPLPSGGQFGVWVVNQANTSLWYGRGLFDDTSEYITVTDNTTYEFSIPFSLGDATPSGTYIVYCYWRYDRNVWVFPIEPKWSIEGLDCLYNVDICYTYDWGFNSSAHLKLSTSTEPTGAAWLLLQTNATKSGSATLATRYDQTKNGSATLATRITSDKTGAACLVPKRKSHTKTSQHGAETTGVDNGIIKMTTGVAVIESNIARQGGVGNVGD